MNDDIDRFIATAPAAPLRLRHQGQGRTDPGSRPDGARASPASSTSWAAKCTGRGSPAKSCRAAPTGRSCGRTAPSRWWRATPSRARSGSALIYVQNEGLRVASPDILARMSRGEPVPFDSYHFRTAPQFETAEPTLEMAGARDLRRRGRAHARPRRHRLPRGPLGFALGDARQPIVDQGAEQSERVRSASRGRRGRSLRRWRADSSPGWSRRRGSLRPCPGGR